jgi:hypothetical protein
MLDVGLVLKKAAFFQGIGANPLFAAKDRWT